MLPLGACTSAPARLAPLPPTPAHALEPGHANVPEDWEPNLELGQWVKRQRVARAAGQLNEERLAILASMGFEFGEVAQVGEAGARLSLVPPPPLLPNKLTECS